MALCASTCASKPPPYPGAGCAITKRKGGISRLVFMSCDQEFNDILDPAEWCALVLAGHIVATGSVLASFASGGVTKEKLASCTPAEVTGKENNITAKDFNADLEDHSDYDFWNEIQLNTRKYQFGWLNCDGSFQGFIPDWAIEANMVIPEDSKMPSYWDVKPSWDAIILPKPIVVPNLASILSGNCQITDYLGNS